MDIKYLEAIRSLPKHLFSMLESFPPQLQKRTREICIRADRPLVISAFSEDYFLKRDGSFHSCLPVNPYIVTKEELFDCIKILTEYSLHSYKSEINAGFITIKGGHRAGVAGSCVYDNGKIISVGDISSINLRIARQVKGIATELVRSIYQNGVCSTLVVGSPASGKTTLLKDMARCLSNGTLPFSAKLSVIDERGEIAAVYRGVPQNDLGVMTDVFDGYRKGDGMSFAIRSMSPKVLMIDEVAGIEDADSIRQSLNAGVAVIATVHAADLEELYRKTFICEILREGAFRHIVFLDGADKPGTVKEIVSPKEMQLC